MSCFALDIACDADHVEDTASSEVRMRGSGRFADRSETTSAEFRRVRPYVLWRDQHRCVLCGSVDRLAVDHIVPRSHGGGDDVSNLRVLCHEHHAEKTASEAAQGRRARYAARFRARERHPGLCAE